MSGSNSVLSPQSSVLLGRRLVRAARGLGYRLGDLLAFCGPPVPAALCRPVRRSTWEVYDAHALLRGPGCPICCRADQDVQRMVFWFLLESYGEGPWIERLCATGGFCPAHFWALARTGARYQLSYVAQYLAEHDLRALGQVAARVARTRPRSPGTFAELIRSDRCPACRTWDESARRSVELLLRTLEDDTVRVLWRRSGGLCWPHLQLTVALADEAALPEVLEVERERFEALLQDGAADFEPRAAWLLAGWGSQ
ncbi:MAG: hypothetical protein HY690_08600 [Chloroflexi bacterium]|nr:hypothetical protein [Chloroflexota bacterium]